MAKMVQVQLHEAFKGFTGLLNNVYPVRAGVATVPEDATKVLTEYYGGKVIEASQPPKQEEPKK